MYLNYGFLFEVTAMGMYLRNKDLPFIIHYQEAVPFT